MANYISQTGNIDQVGGDIILPYFATHVPRNDGNFFTMPSGLQIKGNRKFIWSIESFIPGLIGITNERTSTPTIQFDSNVFSQVFIRIKCTLIGQNNRAKEYILFTVSTSETQTGFYPFSQIANNNYYSVKNLDIVASNSNSIYIGGSNTSNNVFYLEWSRSLYSVEFAAPTSYLVEIWDGQGFEFYGVSTNENILITNITTTYRVTPLYLNSEVKTAPTTFLNTTDSLNSGILSTSSTNSKIQDLGFVNNFTQTSNNAAFFTNIEQFSTLDLINSKITTPTFINNFSNLNNTIFFTDVSNYNNEDILNSKITNFINITNFSQNTTSNNLFWTELIGS
jgi:hypothetical protein